MGYWIAFIFPDFIDNTSKELGMEESHLFLFVLLVCAVLGGITGACSALVRANKQKSIDKKKPFVLTGGDDVWLPAPKP